MADDQSLPPTTQPEAPAAVMDSAPQQPASVNVLNPDGDLVSIPQEHLEEALAGGYVQATPQDVSHYEKTQKYDTGTEALKTAAEGAGEALTFGLSTGLEQALGAKKEDIQGRREINPGAHMAGQAAGLVGSAFIPVAGAANVLEHAGQAAVEAAGLAGAENATAKIGSAALKGAVENMAFQGGDEISKALSGDPGQSAETALTDIGLASVLGAGVGTAFGAVSPLWEATMGSKVGGVLKGVTAKMGGKEILDEPMVAAMQGSGMEIAPEVRARLSNDPAIQQMSKTLEQSDTTGSGLAHQKALSAFRKDAGDEIVRTFGQKPESIAEPLSKYEGGKKLGETLAKEYQAKMDPLSKEFGELKAKYAEAELPQDTVVKGGPDYSNPYAPSTLPDKVIPGTVSQVSDRLVELANREGWTASPSSDIMKEVQRTLKELPAQKSLKDLGNFISQVGNNTSSDLMNGPLRRAGQMINGILKEAEADVAMAKLGDAAPELVDRYKLARQAYKAQAQLKEALDDRLKIGGSTNAFGKNLKEMASTDGERVFQRLSGKNDADLLRVLSDHYPETAQALKDIHIQNLLEVGASKAKDGETISSAHLLSNLNKMSPELRNFAVTPEQAAKVEAINAMLERLNRPPHNFSNIARVADKLMSPLASSAMGLGAMLTGHNPATGLLVGSLTKLLGKDAPDAARLALLKFLGSGAPVDSAGFKAAVDYIQASVKGENLVQRSVKNLFKSGQEVLPQSAIPTERVLSHLDKATQALQTNPQPLMNTGGKTNYYLPQHGGAISQHAASATNYINSQRPNDQPKVPLDTKQKPTPQSQSAFKRTLEIAQQPLTVMQRMQNGTLTPKDVVDMRSMYPNLYNKMAGQLNQEMVDQLSKGNSIPYKTRMGMSVFLGQPLDTTMTPAGIQGAQPQAKEPPAQPSSPQGNVKKGTAALNKLPGQYATPGQARQKDRQSE